MQTYLPYFKREFAKKRGNNGVLARFVLLLSGMGKKKLRNCNKKRIRKDLLEKVVIDITVNLLNNEESLTLIATEIIKLHSEKTESESMLKILSEHKNEAVKSLNNIMKALEAGIINDTTKNRMAELERTIKEFDNKILYEKAKIENCVTVDDIKKFVLTALKKTSYALIRNLIKQIVVYDDKIEIFYYYTSKNPDDNGRDFTLIEGSDNYPLVHLRETLPFPASGRPTANIYFVNRRTTAH